MSSEDAAIVLNAVSKEYMVFEKPAHRLWQMLFRGKRRFYRAQEVLKGISFPVRRGETVGLIGRNGSGKSTLLSIICGTLPASSGDVVINGKIAALLELGAGFNPELSGSENLDLCAKIYGLSDQQIAERYDSMVKFADIGEYISQPVKTYSSGMFTRLAFAVVAHVDADILVIDEALAVGDAYFVQKCMRFLAAFRESGGTLLFVSHDMGSVTSLCDRAIWLRDGRVAMDASPKEVSNAYLADLYLAQQGEGERGGSARSDVANDVHVTTPEDEPQDPRRDLLLHSNLRNDLEVFKFASGHDFGLGGAEITSVQLSGPDGRQVSWVIGGELVRIGITSRALTPMGSPIVGFVLKDRQGQPLFGDNTFLSYMDNPCPLEAGDPFHASFEFRMPILATGTYSISVAVADGTQANHVVHQWLHDAVVVSSHSTSLSTGLMGIPMRSILLERG
jgi:lipopolysaccharide transport system ATP-binding protein